MKLRVPIDRRSIVLIGLLLVLAIESPARLGSPLLKNLGNLYLTNSIVRPDPTQRSVEDLLEWPLSLNSLPGLVTASSYLEAAIAYRPQDVGAHRSLGLARVVQGDYERAADCFSQVASLAPNDVATTLGLANVYRRLNRPQKALAYYDSILPTMKDYDSIGPFQSHYELAINQRMFIEHIRAGHELVLADHYGEAQPYVRMVLATDPANVVALYDQAKIDANLGVSPSSAEDALRSCQFELPRDDILNAYLPEIASDLVQKAMWEPVSAIGINGFLDWRQKWNLLGESDLDDETGIDTTYLLINHQLVPNSGTAQPDDWKWRPESGGRSQQGVFFGGIEWFEHLETPALRMSGICVAQEPDKGLAHAGYSPPWIRVEEGVSYLLSFVYRTDPLLPGLPGVYLAWGENKSEDVKMGIELSATGGAWQRYESVISNPLPSAGDLYLKFVSVGVGTVWFADIGLRGVK